MISEPRLKQLITEEEIYTHVLGAFTLGERLYSPLPRIKGGKVCNESNPSLVVEEKELDHKSILIWRDWGLPRPEENDAIGLIQEIHDLDRKEAVQYIFKNLVGKCTVGKVKRGHTASLVPQTGSLRYHEIKYFMEQFHMDYKDAHNLLWTNGIKSLRSLYKGDYRTTFCSRVDDPAFWWRVGEGWKAYRPLCREDRFRSSNLYMSLEGYDMLPRSGNNLVLASGRKDSLACVSLGYPSCAPTSENTLTAIKAKARELKSRFRKVYVLYDNDYTGIERTKELCNICDFIPIFIPDTRGEIKDVTNMLHFRGRQYATEFFRQNIL